MVLVDIEVVTFSNHQLRNIHEKPTPNRIYMYFHVIFSLFTPLVPKQDSANMTTQNNLLQIMELKTPVVLAKLFSILSSIPTVKFHC